MCCDLVDVEYADDNEGLIEMKVDLENQCNVLGNREHGTRK